MATETTRTTARKPLAGASLVVVALMIIPGPAFAGLVAGTNVQVFKDPRFQLEAAIAVNPLDPKNIIVGAFDARQTTDDSCAFVSNTKACEAWIGIYTTFDGGKTWTSQLFPGFPGGPSASLSGFDYGVHAAVGFDRNGNAYMAANFFNSSGFFANIKDLAIAVSRSTDGGGNWSDPVIVTQGQGGGARGVHPQLAIDRSGGSNDGTVYIAWQDSEWGNGGKGILVGTSRDQGQTWSSQTVSVPTPAGDSLARYWSPHVAVGPKGEVYVAWLEQFKDNANSPKGKLWMTVSLDGGRSFDDPKVVVTGLVPVTRAPIDLAEGSRPVVAVDTGKGTHSGRLYLTWADQRSGDPDILMASSDDRGANWSSLARVNQDSGNANQFDPWTSVAPDGRVDVAFYDRRDDTNDTLVNRYYARSVDGGANFTELRVSDKSSDPAVFPWFGEWNQIASTSNAAILAWADARNGQSGNSNMDIYFATVAA